MSFSKEIFSNEGVGKQLLTIGSGLVALGGVGSVVFKARAKVPEGSMGVRLSWDAVAKNKQGQPVPVVLPPGLHGIVPFKHTVATISTQSRSNTLPDLTIQRPEQWEVRAAVFWSVSPDGFNPYRALYHAKGGEDELSQIVTETCANNLRAVMEKVDESDMRNEQEVYRQTHYRTYEELLYYGVEFNRLKLLAVALTPPEIIGSALLQQGSDPGPGTGAVAAAEAVPGLHIAGEAAS